MRITKEFNISQYKCTLFLYESKYTLQVEDSNYLVQFKLGDMDSSKINTIEDIMSGTKMRYHIEKTFGSLHDNKIVMDSMLHQGGGDSFPEII